MRNNQKFIKINKTYIEDTISYWDGVKPVVLEATWLAMAITSDQALKIYSKIIINKLISSFHFTKM